MENEMEKTCKQKPKPTPSLIILIFLVQIVKKAALIPASKYVRIASSSIKEKSRIRAAYMKLGKGYGFFHFITWSI
jgi:hypothetical protein